ncbi:MAG: tetratricopeptide repeat protein [Desulfobacterales bacterium]|nr:MAG: tetratricopeptide repeat protein [Desulfobacterales bacterium]
MLERGQPDDAIRVLEQAINLNTTNGENYYYLAEAWLMKGNLGQAAEFNRLAEIYLEQDPQWSPRVRRQRERIKR